MIRKEKPGKPLGSLAAELSMIPNQPGTPVGKLPKPIDRPGGPGKTEMPSKPKPPKDFGKMLGQQPITMGEDYKKQINNIRPIGNGSAMNKQYRAQGGGRFK